MDTHNCVTFAQRHVAAGEVTVVDLPACMEVSEVTDASGEPVEFGQHGTQLFARVPVALAPGDQLRLLASYPRYASMQERLLYP